MLICLMLASWRMFALDFESVNYYTKNYLFDGQIYSVNTFVSENTFSHQLGDFTPHLNYIQYQGLDQYKESDFGLGSEYKLTDKLTLDAGSWYYYYYSAGDHYFEPYRPVVGTADYDNRYVYYGSVIRFDYDVNKFLGIFTVGEIDKPFSSPDNSIVYTYSFGLRISL